jgi:hypothetical protein
MMCCDQAICPIGIEIDMMTPKMSTNNYIEKIKTGDLKPDVLLK